MQQSEPVMWMPIETAPKDGTAVLLTSVHEDGCGGHYTYGGYPQVASWLPDLHHPDHSWVGEGRFLSRCYGSPTHWMALPLPPWAASQPSPEPPSADLVEVVDAEAARTFISEWPHHSFADFIEPALAEAFARHRRAAIAAMDNAAEKQIIAWLRAKPTGLGCRYEPSLLADAIERGAHKEHQP